MELEALQEVYEDIQKLGGSLVAVSPQLGKYTKQVVKKNSLHFPVLVDAHNTYAQKLGLVFTLPSKLKEIYSSLGIDLPRFNGDDTWTLPLSGRFMVESQGVIQQVDVHPDHTTRPEPSDIIDFLQSS